MVTNSNQPLGVAEAGAQADAPDTRSCFRATGFPPITSLTSTRVRGSRPRTKTVSALSSRCTLREQG